MIYPIKTLSQLPLVLKSFRKEKGLTQAAMAEKLGITQQSYAYFEANPATATLERLYMALRLLDVEISLDQNTSATSETATPPAKAANRKISKPTGTAATKVVSPKIPARKKENW